jgi:hypothetical protein
VAETVTRLLDATRAHVGFALRRGGEQVLANVLHVAELARQYERNDGCRSAASSSAARGRRAGDATEAPIVEDGSDGVRLMTVHKAKGLEFPVVVLADITAKLAQLEASRSIDVRAAAARCGSAAGRRRICCCGRPRARRATWPKGVRLALRGRDAGPRSARRARGRRRAVRRRVGEPAQRAIYPPAPAAPGRRRRACPPLQARLRAGAARRRHRAGVDGEPGAAPDRATAATRHDIVWWDPFALQLDVAPPFGLRREELIAKDVPARVIDEGTARYDELAGAAPGDAGARRAHRGWR